MASPKKDPLAARAAKAARRKAAKRPTAGLGKGARKREAEQAELTPLLHEAAHTVVGLTLNMPITQVTRDVPEWGMLGSAGVRLPSDYTAARYPSLARRGIVISLAGIAAEERAAGAIDIAGARSDIEDAYESADALAQDDTLELLRECQDEARQLVRKHWDAIERVAAALANRPEDEPWIDDSELRRIIGIS